jgi:hypothetical protein
MIRTGGWGSELWIAEAGKFLAIPLLADSFSCLPEAGPIRARHSRFFFQLMGDTRYSFGCSFPLMLS